MQKSLINLGVKAFLDNQTDGQIVQPLNEKAVVHCEYAVDVFKVEIQDQTIDFVFLFYTLISPA